MARPKEHAMNDRLAGLKNTLLMGPGPSCVYDSVYTALSRPTIGHLDPYFVLLMDDIKERLKQIFNTGNRLTMPMSGTGSAGMETCFVNLIEPGDKVLVLTNGVFGKRMQDVAARLGAEVDALEVTWGEPVLPDDTAKKLGSGKYDVVAVVHAETSTGVCSPVGEIGKLVKEHGALYIVDCVTSLGGMPVAIDAWQADAVYSGTQKCLSCPPGLSPVSFSEQAVARLKARKTKVPNWYLDLAMIVSYWEGTSRTYHHTAPINMLYGLYAALGEVLSEGLENSFARHKAAHEQLASGLAALGLELTVDKDYRLPMLNAVSVPKGVDEAGVRSRLLKEFDIEIGAGLGPLAGKIWRVGLMGHTARAENVTRLLDTLKKVL